jgi:polyisoprenoid-binding protein YceI
MSPFTRSSVGAAAFALLASTGWPAAAQQTLVPAQSDISFVSRQMGVPVEGRFKRFDAQLAFDPRKPDSAKIAISIDLASVSLGTDEAEAELAKPDWFATRQFPQASFQSRAVKPLGSGRFEVAGQLSLKGVSRDIVVPVTLVQAGATTTASGAFTLQRLDFKVGEGDWKDTSIVNNDVQVKFRLALNGVPAL